MSANKSKSNGIGSTNTQGKSIANKGSKKTTGIDSKPTVDNSSIKKKELVSVISVGANFDDEFGDTWDVPVSSSVVLESAVLSSPPIVSLDDEFADSWDGAVTSTIPVISTTSSNQLTTDEKDVVSNAMSNVVSGSGKNSVDDEDDSDNDIVDNSEYRKRIGDLLIENLMKKGYDLYKITGDMIAVNWNDVKGSLFLHSINKSHISTVFKAINDYGFQTPREIQMLSILSLLKGEDFIGQAPAGSGKTCAFGVPIVLRTDPTRRGVQAIILTPTAILAEQHCEFLQKISEGTGLVIKTWIGGSQYPNRDNMPHIVVGTPGRVCDLLNKTFFCKRNNCLKKSIDLSKLKSIVLDEADELLSQSFKSEVASIIVSCPETTQTCVFSATFPPWMMNICREFMEKDCPNIIVPEKRVITIRVNQHYSKCRDDDEKMSDLIDCIGKNPLSTIIVFCNTCAAIKRISDSLIARGINNLCVNGRMLSDERTKILKLFFSRECRILLASDVIARGFDFTDIGIVINYDMPNRIETYIHRIGRTGRAGEIGNAVTLITTEQEMAMMKYIVQFHGMPIKETVTKSSKTKDGKSRVKFIFN
jgi:superfamily II DNA/RNA helicase